MVSTPNPTARCIGVGSRCAHVIGGAANEVASRTPIGATRMASIVLSGVRRGLTDRAEAAGDAPAGARVVDDSPSPPGARHSDSPRATTVHQLQALVRPRPACEQTAT